MNRFEFEDIEECITQAERYAWIIIILFGITLLGLLIFVGNHWQAWNGYIYERTGMDLTLWILFGALGMILIGTILFLIWPVVESLHSHITNWIFDSMKDGGWWSKL